MKQYNIFLPTKFLYLNGYTSSYLTWVVPQDKHFAIKFRKAEGRALLDKIGNQYGVLRLEEIDGN